MNAENFNKFAVAYEEGLTQAVKTKPEEYYYPVEEVPKVVEKMMKAIREEPKMVNYNGSGFKLTCKKLGIKNTRKAILEYLGVCVERN